MSHTIKMHWKWFLLQTYIGNDSYEKCIGNDFYCKNASDNDFYHKKVLEIIINYENALDNDFYYKIALEMIFTVKMHLK